MQAAELYHLSNGFTTARAIYAGASAQFTVWLFDYGKQLFETTFLWCALVVFSSCSSCFQSQTAWVKNADAPFKPGLNFARRRETGKLI